MKAVVCEKGELEVADLPDPHPADGQVLLEVNACGICGSDLHARHHADAQADVLAESGYDGFMRSHERVVFGHEFCGTVLEYGSGTTKKVASGSAVVALPLRRAGEDMHPIGLSAAAPGAYAERVLVEEPFMFAVPNGLATQVAALTEPMAIGHHAVQRAEIGKKDAAVVIGCGPVGLAVICMLKAAGVETVIASDLSPARRSLAAACGATTVVDPGESSPYDALADRGYASSMVDGAAEGLAGLRKLQQLPVPSHLVLRMLDTAGVTKPKRPIIFECVGIPGMIEDIISHAPLSSRIIVVGVCMESDAFRPAMAINKQVELRFVVGYSPVEFRRTLHLLAEGKIDAGPLVTGVVGLGGVSTAFDALADPGAHAKIVIDPRSAAVSP